MYFINIDNFTDRTSFLLLLYTPQFTLGEEETFEKATYLECLVLHIMEDLYVFICNSFYILVDIYVFICNYFKVFSKYCCRSFISDLALLLTTEILITWVFYSTVFAFILPVADGLRTFTSYQMLPMYV